MNLQKVFLLFAITLFGLIALLAFFKTGKQSRDRDQNSLGTQAIEVELEKDLRPAIAQTDDANKSIEIIKSSEIQKIKAIVDEDLPTANRIEEFFNKSEPKLPIVETITYKSRVDWLKGRPAWLADYASHYKTSRHFIARSLNGKPDYTKQDVGIGDRFNVFKLDKEVSFYLVIDVSRSKMWFYYYDKDSDEHQLIKTYDVGLGRVDSNMTSGLLTPLGVYRLGDKVAIYKPHQKGWHNGEKLELISVFGTRWIPFETEIDGCTAPAKGFGIHGAPWKENAKGELVEDRQCIGRYESDGCIRLKNEDIEEIFSIVISKPTYVALVKNFHEARLPGRERK
jgi:hypothetical protein